MSIAKMKKIQILGLKRQKAQMIDLLQGLSLVEFDETEENRGSLDRDVNYNSLLSDLDFVVNFLEPHSIIKKSFIDNFAITKEEVAFHDVKDIVSKLDFKTIVKECRSLESELVNLNELIKGLNREKELLMSWKSLDCPLKSLVTSKYVKYITGTISNIDLALFEQETSKLPISVQVVSGDKLSSHVLIALVFDSALEEDIGKALVEHGFNEIRLPVSNRTASEESENIEISLKEAFDRKSMIHEAACRFAKDRFSLMLVHDFFMQKKSAQDAEKKTGLTTYTFRLQGWIKNRELVLFKKKVSVFFPESVVVEVEPMEDESPPVAIDNVSILKPFEVVTDIYGLPAYKEVDPTPLLSTFFIIFFGLCLGDAGYGITLSIVSYIFYKRVGPTCTVRPLLKLLVYAGIATFIAGAIVGGWFGVEPKDFPSWLANAREFLLSIRVIDPVQNPIAMLMLSLALGVTQVIFGLFVNAYIKVREKDYFGAIFDDLIWIYFLIVIILGIAEKTKKIVILPHISWFILAGVGLLVLTQGRKEKNIIFKFGKGLLSLYNVVGLMSDILSYSRILALGLATSIIAMVINMISMMTKDIPYLGYVLMAIVLVGGHIFNIAINVLGAFIHSARLQFVEFFSKFMQGGGLEFRPFKREGKFVEMK